MVFDNVHYSLLKYQTGYQWHDGTTKAIAKYQFIEGSHTAYFEIKVYNYNILHSNVNI